MGTQSSGRKPVAVLISDIHYSLSTLALADAALWQAIDKASELGVRLIIAGDLHDTKAIIRGECANKMIETFELALTKQVDIFVLVGNHDLINEKGKENSLEFLTPHCTLIRAPLSGSTLDFIPYQADPENFKAILSKIPSGATIIMHQGVTGAESGEYVHDKSAINKDLLEDYRVISGHYHRAQDIKCGRPRKGAVGLMSYIGSPYSVTFAEANDGPKGFQVLYSDGLMEQVPTNLRKHVIFNLQVESGKVLEVAPNNKGRRAVAGDIIWVKIKGPALELDKVRKTDISNMLQIGHNSFKLDKIVTDAPKLLDKEMEKKSNDEILDLLIDASGESDSKKTELKALWRSL